MTLFLSENIKKLRQKRDLTQENLADYLGVTFQSISNWERGETYPDITMLPSIAIFFNVTVDELLGVNKVQQDKNINEYLEFYETMKLKDIASVYNKFKSAVREFPGDFRILIRYMELLQEVKDSVYDPEYTKTSKELISIYENIQTHCTDDGIRIRAKTIIISHYLKKYQCLTDKNGNYYSNSEYLIKAQEIANSLPTIKDSKEIISMGLAFNEKTYEITHKKAIEELLFLLNEASFGYCYNYPCEQRLKIFISLNNLLNTIFKEGDYGKNCFCRLYNYGHIGHLYQQIGDNKNALKYLKLASEYAKELDNSPNISESVLRYHNYGPIYRESTACQFMKTVMTEHYKLTDEFKNSADFRKIIDFLAKEDN